MRVCAYASDHALVILHVISVMVCSACLYVHYVCVHVSKSDHLSSPLSIGCPASIAPPTICLTLPGVALCESHAAPDTLLVDTLNTAKARDKLQSEKTQNFIYCNLAQAVKHQTKGIFFYTVQAFLGVCVYIINLEPKSVQEMRCYSHMKAQT